MKRITIILLSAAMIFAAACSGGQTQDAPEPEAADAQEQQEQSVQSAESSAEEDKMTEMILKINGEEVNVTWEDNDSVRALAELAAGSGLTAETSIYGGFEQVGGLGTALPSSDTQQTAQPGDIMLYSSSNIVVFFGNNSWAYTKLGHIEGKSADELRALLGGETCEITLLSN